MNLQKKFPVIINTTSIDSIKLYTKPKKIKVYGKDSTDEIDMDEHLQLPADVASPEDMKDYINSFKEDEPLDPEQKEKKTKKNHSFQSVSGTADGVHFDSKWEYAYYLYVKEIEGHSIERNTGDYLYYIDAAGKRRKFYYDFIVDGNPYEVKGIFRANDVLKMEQCPQVVFIYGEEMKRILKTVNKELPGWEKGFVTD